MREDLTASLAPRAALRRRLDALAEEARRLSCGTIASEIESIRLIAAGHRLFAVEAICRAFCHALAADGRGALMGRWFEALGDAIGCRPMDERAAAQSCLASVMVRLN